MNNSKISVSVIDELKDMVSEILYSYKVYWRYLLPSGYEGELLDGCVKIVNALNSAYNDYSWNEKRFISELFMFDFISSFSKEEWFGRFLTSDRVSQKYKANCLYHSTMVAECIYGGLPSVFPLADTAKRNCLTEEGGKKLYNDFWQKAINVLKDNGENL